MRRRWALPLALAVMAQAPAPDTWLPKPTAEIVMLDKIRAQPTTLTVRTGQQSSFGSLTIAVRSCLARPPDMPQNSAAFLDVTDGRGSVPPFHGWLLSNTPSVSQYEHPLYDLRLVTCK